MQIYSQHAIAEDEMDEMTIEFMEFILSSVREALGREAGVPADDPRVRLRFDRDNIFGGYIVRMTVEA